MENQGRFLLFLVMSTVILVVYSYFFQPSPPKSAPSSVSVTNNSAQTLTNSNAPKTTAAELNTLPIKTQKPAIGSNVTAKVLRVETDDYVASFSNEGAVLTAFELKKFKNRHSKDPVNLVNADPGQPLPFTTVSDSFPQMKTSTYEVVGESKKLTSPKDTYRITFRTASKDVVVEKTFKFTNGSYLIGFDVAVKNYGSKELSSAPLKVEWSSNLGPLEFTGTQSNASGGRVAIFSNGKVSKEKPKKSNETVEIQGPINWVALADQFFMAALIPDPASGTAGVRVARDTNIHVPPAKAGELSTVDPKSFAPRPILSYAAPTLARGEGYSRSGQVYLGPQVYEVLKSYDLQLERVVDFGIFGFISVYMLRVLKWFYAVFHNWGLAIILLSLLVKILLWWPTHNSYIQMSQTQRKMKELQPQLDNVKKRHAGDTQKINQETMALYQKAGINPTAGCLPMVFQIPVFFALYATLQYTVELRGAPFILWIKDLSLSDPIYVLPILMGITMIVQQRASGQMSGGISSGQQKFMMWFFPVFLTAISLQWPSGLLVYWVVTNLLSIVQQKMVNRQLKKARS